MSARSRTRLALGPGIDGDVPLRGEVIPVLQVVDTGLHPLEHRLLLRRDGELSRSASPASSFSGAMLPSSLPARQPRSPTERRRLLIPYEPCRHRMQRDRPSHVPCATANPTSTCARLNRSRGARTSQHAGMVPAPPVLPGPGEPGRSGAGAGGHHASGQALSDRTPAASRRSARSPAVLRRRRSALGRAGSGPIARQCPGAQAARALRDPAHRQ